jgi:putative NIF3 family GTP cyclohydrolase 1 type 2
MQQAELVNRLDTFFSIEAFNEASFWRLLLNDSGFRMLQEFGVPGFAEGPWNGLMLDNTRKLENVYLVVYPGRDVLDTIIAREVVCGAPGALIFAHYPLDFEVNGRGYVPIPAEQLEELKEHSISYYVCHAPLDCHPEISSPTALANQLGLREQVRFSPHFGGLGAVHGVVGKEIGFQAFAARLAKVTDVSYLRYDQVRHAGLPVHRVAVVPGPGGDPGLIEEAAGLGCDTYVTGVWWHYTDSDISRERRTAFLRLVGKLRMNLIGVSPYASEVAVLRDQMPGWFHDLDLDAEFVPQGDPWR